MQEPAERRRVILEAARRLLTHYGPQKTTIAEIAREAGVGVGTVYLDFASKEAILAVLSHDDHEDVLDDMRKAASLPRHDAAARLRLTLQAKVVGYMRVARRGAHAKDLLHCTHAAVREQHARFKEAARAIVAELLREGARRGELAVDDPEQTAMVVLRAYASFSPPWVFDEPEDKIALLVDHTHDLILFGLVARNGKRRR